MEFNYEMISIKMDKNVFKITLNKPDTHNALDEKMLNEIEHAIYEAEKKEDIGVIIIQGSGNKSFAAGADIHKLNKKKSLHALTPGMQELYNKIENCNKVTIAIVQGFALGGGCELALSCDIRIATKNAKFGFPELNLGIIPSAGGTQRLSRMIGKGRALDMIITGKIINGEEAEKIGLVSYFVDEQELHETTNKLSKEIIKKGPIAMFLAKKSIHKGYDIDRDAAMWIEKLSQSVLFGTEDKNEGTQAFLEKRQANFKNK